MSSSEVGGPYSPLKIFHHRERIDALKRGEQIVPVQIQLTLSGGCNADCAFCAYRWSGNTSNQLFTAGVELMQYGTNNPRRLMPFEKAIEVLDDCKEMGVRAVQCTGSGEPTVHPRHIEVFQAVLDRGLDLSLVTNGMIFRPGLIPILLKSKWVRISFDAGTPESYSKIRRVSPDTMGRVLANVRKLVDERRRLIANGGKCDLIIGGGFVVTKDNWHEVIEFTKIARDAGFDNVRISAVFQPDGANYFKDFHHDAAVLCKEAESLSTDDFKVFNNFGFRTQDLLDRNPDYEFCGYQQFVTYVADDLNIYRCCVYAFNEHGLIGSIRSQRFKDLWESDQKKRNFEEFNAKHCERCMYNKTNKTILYALGDDAPHVNFV